MEVHNMKPTPADKFGIRARGRAELIKADRGESLTRGEAILAKCYECMGGYDDGRYDCLVSTCPLHQYMPYRGCKPRSKRN